MPRLPTHNTPTTLVLFGATGDLVARKMLPALYHLHRRGLLPDHFRVVGVARRPFTDQTFRELARQALNEHLSSTPNPRTLASFLQRLNYQQTQLTEANDYILLKQRLDALDGEWGLCSNKLFSLSVTPEMYETVFEHLATSRLAMGCGPKEGDFTRILVEKPFGNNAKSAERLDEKLGTLFRENQIYRIDHYLAKDMLQNMLTFRFSNLLLEPAWNQDHIERIEITLLESLGVETRGDFYDHTGTLRDVGQNHLLQMLALVTMDHPGSNDGESIRATRARILTMLPIMSDADVQTHTQRGQYHGYLDIEGVAPQSSTETSFRIETHLEHPRWKQVPIIIEAGKHASETRKEIVVTFKHPHPCLCPPGQPHDAKNQVIFRLEPDERITITFWSKKPGLEHTAEARAFEFIPRKRANERANEYEKLLLDAIIGDTSLFVSTQEIKAMWRFIDPIVDAWKRNIIPLTLY